jgi:hypothetical protein
VENTAFPLYSNRRGRDGHVIVFANRVKNCMPGADPALVAEVESLQPYNRRKNPKTAYLGKLRDINNWDKHRRLAIASFALLGSELNVRVDSANGRLIGHEIIRGPLKSGAVIARIQLYGYFQLGEKVYVDPKLTTSPVFGNGMPRHLKNVSVFEVLTEAGKIILNDVMEKLRKFL